MSDDIFEDDERITTRNLLTIPSINLVDTRRRFNVYKTSIRRRRLETLKQCLVSTGNIGHELILAILLDFERSKRASLTWKNSADSLKQKIQVHKRSLSKNNNNKTDDRSSRPEVFCKKGVLRNFIKSTGKHLCQSLFSNKVAGLRQPISI